MIYQAIPDLTKRLLEMNESGMGYQLIQARKNESFRLEKFVIYNGQLIVDLDDNFEQNRTRILNEGFKNVFSASRGLNLNYLQLFSEKIGNGRQMFSESKKTNFQRHSGGQGAVQNSIEVVADGIKVYVRLSAFENDRRVDMINKCFLPGTYSTTETDYQTCRQTNDDPVDRYALPNNDAIEWVFKVKPKKGDKYKYGIVQPNFGHNGGGIEVLFTIGTSQNTLFSKARY